MKKGKKSLVWQISKVCAVSLLVFTTYMGMMEETAKAKTSAKAPKKITLSTSTGVKKVYIGGPSKYASLKIKVGVQPKKASSKVKFINKKPKIAKVTSSGKVTGKKVGTAKIVAVSKVKPSKKKTISIKVVKYEKRVRPGSISARISKTTLLSGGTAKITASVKPADTTNKTIKYRSTNNALATVTSSGIVTANTSGRAGVVKIRVYCGDKNKRNQTVYKDFSITVLPVAVESVSTLATKKIGTSMTEQLYASVRPFNATNKTLKYTSSNPAVVSVNAKGEITSHEETGVAVITVTSSNGKKATCRVQVEVKQISIHDPSITVDKDGTYYLFGTHLGAGKSNDLKSWTDIGGCFRLFGVSESKFVSKMNKVYSWMNISSYASKNFTYTWAPSVIYNETTKKYYYYACTSEFGTTDSVIWFATADKITGPYSAPTPIIYSGFINQTAGTWSYNRTNIKELIANKKLDGVSSSWFDSKGNYNSAPGRMPNAIDPTVFYDKNGKMWMTYGSFSGGIYILEIDTKTGMPIYPARDDKANNVVAYFGKQITTSVSTAGSHGNGEGPFIMYDPASDYYYLYITYGGLGALDGYNARVFRSKNPDGPYEDGAGNNAMTGVNKGLKMMGNYQITSTPGYLSPGHTSELADRDGKLYHIYHTRFNDGAGNGHLVRVHQMFVNSQGWTVPLPYAYTGETISKTGYNTDEVVGIYEFINHGNTTVTTDSFPNVGSIMGKSQTISLNQDGTIGGDKSGTWSFEGENTPNVKLEIDGVTYYGVFCYQRDESGSRQNRMVFSAAGSDNCTIWGVKYNQNEEMDKALTSLTNHIQGNVRSDLPGKDMGGLNISYTSSNPAVISSEGKVTRGEADQKVTLQVKLERGTASKTKSISVTVKASVSATVNAQGILAQYSFDDSGDLGKDASGNGLSAITNDTAFKDSFAGRNGVLQFTGGLDSFVKLPAEICRTEDFTFSGWVYSTKADWWQRIFDLGDGEGNSAFLTNCGGAGVLRFDLTSTKTGFYLDDNEILPLNSWNHIAVTMKHDGSAALYLNGKLVSIQNAGSLKFMLNDFAGTNNYLGKSQYAADPLFEGYMDDITFYGKALTAQEIEQLAK